MLTASVQYLIAGFARLVTGAQARWIGCAPLAVQRIYFANHSSHGDFVLIWAALPPALRASTRPIAGADYWDRGTVKRFLIRDVFNGVLIDRTRAGPGEEPRARTDPIEPMASAVEQGFSLILFPEGTRNTTEESLLPFKSGIYHLAKRCPQVELVPVWIENLHRVMPKGEFLPVPLLCSVNFGEPLRLVAEEDKHVFVERARNALLALGKSVKPG
jgi:1-acyl-sn-glycerol-3-phosphate acyltransferase